MIAFIKNNIKITIILLLFSGLIYYFFTRDISLNIKDKKSPYYVNNLYLSNNHAYNQLDRSEKKAYDYMFNALKKSKKSITISAPDFGCVDSSTCSDLLQTLYDAIAVDQPGLINFSSYSWILKGSELTIRFTNATPLKFASEIGMLRIERIIDSIKRKTKNMTDGEKVLYVYEWIGDHATYDRLFTFASKNQSIYNVFIKHNAVCAGFSKTASVIFQNIGIEAYSVTGLMNPGDSVGHMWNIVKIEDKYYFFDSTWAASRNNKDAEDYYFGLIPIEMDSYSLDHPNWYPEVSFEPLPGVLN